MKPGSDPRRRNVRRLSLTLLLLLGIALPATPAHADYDEPVACKTHNRTDFDGGLVHVRVKLTCINPSQRYDYVVKTVVRVATPVDYATKSVLISIGSLDTEVRFFRVTLQRQGTRVVSAPIHIHNVSRSG
jgi:hypothetical protein